MSSPHPAVMPTGAGIAGVSRPEKVDFTVGEGRGGGTGMYSILHFGNSLAVFGLGNSAVTGTGLAILGL